MTQFISFDSGDSTNTKTLLYESIPLTGTVVSGTYADENVKNYTHGMFQSVYDYPYLSSSANHIFDITMGYHSDSEFLVLQQPHRILKRLTYITRCLWCFWALSASGRNSAF